MTDKQKVDLNHTIDAIVWTNEWLKTIKENPSIPNDDGTMIGWFANSIMAGYDAGFVKGAAMNLVKLK